MVSMLPDQFRTFLSESSTEIFPSAWAAFRTAIGSLHAGEPVSIHEAHILAAGKRQELPPWARKYLTVADRRALQTPMSRRAILELLELVERASDDPIDPEAAEEAIEAWVLRYRTPRPEELSSG
jgi:hypothetical protein